MKTIFTVGVFDLLHVGHILLFKHAKELGDRLVVAVQNDDVIKKYKPDAEMVNTTEERLFMVKSIRYVDKVVTYDDVDEIVKKVDFDIFAKGPDQCHEGFQRASKWCEQHGKEVITIPRTEGISSSMLRHLIAVEP